MISAVKVCGVTTVDDADAAIDAGANYLGLIFVESSPRKVDVSDAHKIVEKAKGRAKVVAVVKDSPIKMVRDIVSELAVDFVQFHGAESPEYIKAMNVPAIKVFEVSPMLNRDSLRRYEDLVEFVLFDRPKGDNSPYWLDFAIQKVDDLHLKRLPYFFAGGLTVVNVSDVVRRLHPHAVDVASGVESQPGVKDVQKMVDFVKAVREAETKCGH